MTPPDPAATPRAPLSFATIFAFLGLLAMAAGWWLPWVAELDVGGIGVTRSDLERIERDAARQGAPEDVAAAIRRMVASEAVSGTDLALLGRWYVDAPESDLEPKERRAWDLGLVVLRWAPWAALGAAALLALARLRKPPAPVLSAVIVLAVLVGGLAGLLWLGASQQAREAVAKNPTVLGAGVHAVTLGGLAALLGACFAVRSSNWWKVHLLAFATLAATIWWAVQRVQG
jgi:hypothetical protein